jgi:hypothetical protein
MLSHLKRFVAHCGLFSLQAMTRQINRQHFSERIAVAQPRDLDRGLRSNVRFIGSMRQSVNKILRKFSQ